MLFALTSCAASDSEIERAAETGRLESAAAEMCNAMIGGYPLVSAYQSTIGEVRDAARDAEVKDGWDRNMPTDESTRMAVCIFDVRDVAGLGDNYTFMAMWVGQDSRSGGNGIITLWND